jgi:signal transduction histidine kinase
MPDKFGICCCENIRAEVDAVLASGDFPDVIVSYYRFHCGHVPSAWKNIRTAYEQIRPECDSLILLGCGCLNTIDLPADLRDQPIVIAGAGPELFLPKPLVDQYIGDGAYFVLPGWLSHWREILRCDQLDQSTGRQFFGSSVRGVVLIDTGVSQYSKEQQKEFAEYLNLPERSIPTGLDYFRCQITSRYYDWRFKREHNRCLATQDALTRKSADTLMVFDLIGRITRLQTEDQVIESVLDLFDALFSPKRVGFMPFHDGIPVEIQSHPPGAFSSPEERALFLNLSGEYAITRSEDGFVMKVQFDGKIFGIIEVDHISIPDALNEYLNISLFVTHVCGLSLAIARTYQELTEAIQQRDLEIVERRKAEEAIRVANKKLNLLSSITRHDILNQLTALLIFLDFSREKTTDPEMAGFIDKCLQASSNIQTQIEFSRDYQDLGVQSPVWQNLNAVCRRAIPEHTGIAVIHPPADLDVFADPLLEKVFYNLYDNAMRHGEHVTAIAIGYTPAPEGKGVTITVEDNGAGVSPDMKGRIFQRGVGKNTGLGLFLTREILTLTNITVDETGEPGHGARFEIRVPKEGCRFTAQH